MNFHVNFSLTRKATCPRCDAHLEPFNVFFVSNVAFCKDCFDTSELYTGRTYSPVGGPQPEVVARQVKHLGLPKHFAMSRGITFYAPQLPAAHPFTVLAEIGNVNFVKLD